MAYTKMTRRTFMSMYLISEHGILKGMDEYARVLRTKSEDHWTEEKTWPEFEAEMEENE